MTFVRNENLLYINSWLYQTTYRGAKLQRLLKRGKLDKVINFLYQDVLSILHYLHFAMSGSTEAATRGVL